MFPKFDPINNPIKNLIFHKEFEGARFPERGSDGAAGMDFFIPKPTSLDDSCFEYMKNKCIDSVKDWNTSEDTIKFIECVFDEIKSNGPESAFLSALSLYNKYVFGSDGYEFGINYQNSNVAELILKPGQGINIPSGISANIPHGYAIDFRNKSGIATKKNLVVGAELVDEDYTGIMHLNIHNIGNKSVRISCGMKIAQAVFEKTYYDELNIVNSDTHLDKKTDRGAGGFGSTGLY